MIQDTKRSIAFICPSCRQSVVLERSVFQLAVESSTNAQLEPSMVAMVKTQAAIPAFVPCGLGDTLL